jgi:hypothetical protein
LYVITRVGYSIYLRNNTIKKELQSLRIDSDLGSNLLNTETEATQETNNNINSTNNNEHPEEEPTQESLSQIDYDINLRSYFPLRQPKITFYGLQGILLGHSFYISMLIVHFLNVALNENAISKYRFVNIFVYLLLYVPSLLVLFVFFPITMAPFTILTSVDNYSSHKTILYAVQRAEALLVRANIEKAMSDQPNYHPLKKKLRKAIAEHFPVLEEHGDFQHEHYFTTANLLKRKQNKQLQNLIKTWSRRTKKLKEAKFRAKRRMTLRMGDASTFNDDEDSFVDEVEEYCETNDVIQDQQQEQQLHL